MRLGHVLAPAAILCAWQAWAVVAGDGGGATSPVEVWSGARSLLSTGMPPGHLLPAHIGYSLGRVLLGFGSAVLIGVPLGLASAASPAVRQLVRPVVGLLRPIPPLAWVPLAIGWFGIGLRAAGFIIFLGAVFPIVVSTCAGVSHVPRSYVDVARSMNARRLQLWSGVLLPGARTSIVTGLRVALGVAWMTLVAAEFTDVREGYGLGYMLVAARDLQRTDVVVAGMGVIGLVGWALDLALQRASAPVAET